jgi:hypothetical protein
MDTCLVDKFKFTFDKSEDLQEKAYQFYKEKNGGKKNEVKNQYCIR